MRETLVVFFFLIASFVFTWPLGDFRHVQLPFPHDAMFSTWRLAWVAHQLPNDPAHLFDGNIFWPESNTLAFSDAMLLLGLAGWPLIAAGVHPAAVHNVLLIASFVFAGYAAYRLLRRLTNHTGSALIGGIVFAFAPYRFGHIGHLELLWTGFMPAALAGVYAVLARPTLRRGLWLGMVIALQALCSLYYFLFLVVWLVPVTLLARLHVGCRVTWKHVASLSAGALVVVLALAPYVRPYSDARATLYDRPAEEIQRYSAMPIDYVRAPWGNWLYGAQWAESLEERSLFPGVVVFILIAVSLVLVRSRLVVALAISGAIAVDLSLGVNGVLYPLLRGMVPVLTSIRAPARFGAMALLTFAALSAIAAAHLLNAVSLRRQRWLTAAIVVALGVEYWSVPVSTRETPLSPFRVHQWLAVQPRGAVVELPMPTPEALWRDEPLYQYLSIYHWQPLVNGYSGFVPVSYVRLLEAMREFPSDESLRRLRDRGVRVALLHERLMPPGEFNALVTSCQNPRWFRDVVMFDLGGGAGRTAACRLEIGR
jgi:hypothetical protein